MRAELLSDGGAEARSDDFFRSQEFLEAEGVGHTLVVSGTADRVAIPLIVREIPGAAGLRDATSPYAYPGGRPLGTGGPQRASEVDWAAAGLVSIFVRDRVGGPPVFADPTERSRVLLHDPSRPRDLRPRLAEQIRGNERDGWTVEAVAGPDASAEQHGAFAAAYRETMRRVGAADRYLYPDSYLKRVLAFERAHLLLARSPAGEPLAGAIAAVSDGLLHYYLGGTADAAIEASPFKNVIAGMLALADRRELPLNLGGGVEAGDGLERFKRGFANSSAPFRTHEIVCDPEAYERLAAGRDVGGFFPAYRAP
jgi:hypothetical protein